jgi:hypothetical protein
MGAKGEKNKMHKITEKQVIAIRHLYKNHKITQRWNGKKLNKKTPPPLTRGHASPSPAN